jgi:adenosylcobinamide-phosphate synthase
MANSGRSLMFRLISGVVKSSVWSGRIVRARPLSWKPSLACCLSMQAVLSGSVLRCPNTADAMWGYHTSAYEHLGKAAARLDDALNWLPARLGALLLICLGAHQRRSFSVWRRDAGETPSPNAGQSMAAMAGQLGVRPASRRHTLADSRLHDPSAISSTAPTRAGNRFSASSRRAAALPRCS